MQEVGQLSYDADKDGDGSLDSVEFCQVMDKLGEYHSQKAYGAAQPASGGSFLFGTEGAEMSLKQIIWHTVDDPAFSRLSRVVGFVLLTAIALAVIVFVLQTEPAYELLHKSLFTSLEGWCCAVFTAEYLTRVLTCPSKKRFFLSISNTVDLFTIIPYYMDALYDLYKDEQSGSALRVMRVFRVFRVFKIFKYVPYVSIMTHSAAASAAPICMALFVMLIGMILLAFAAYFTERGTWSVEKSMYVNGDGAMSPFQSIAESSYWAVVTLTTVGYGDLAPASNWGKFVGALTAIAGTVIVSFPVSIYTEEFSKEYNEMVKTKALQAEIAGMDLCDRLTKAHDAQLAGPSLQRFPAGDSLSGSLSKAVPRNLALMRRARMSKIGQLASLIDSEIAMEGFAPDADEAEAEMEPAVTTPAKTRVSDTKKDANIFHSIWTMEMASRTGFDPSDDVARAWSSIGHQHEEERATSGAAVEHGASLQSNEYRRIFQKLEAEQQANQQEQPSVGVHGADQSQQGIYSSDANAMAALNTLRTMFGDSDARLMAASFKNEDLTDDDRLREAILKLLSDKRKQVWAQSRILESRFRDDICVELARRWQYWMAMPREYVREVAEGYVFRNRDLRRGLGYSRMDLAAGLARQPDTQNGPSSSGSSDGTGLMKALSSAGSKRSRSSSALGSSLRGLLTAPSAATAQAVIGHVKDKAVEAGHLAVNATKFAAEKVKGGVTEGVTRVKGGVDRVRAEMQNALEPLGQTDPLDYQARLREQYSEVLGAEGKKVSKSNNKQTATFSHAGNNSSTAKPEEDVDGDGSFVQTAFGVSSVLPNMRTISSSMATGIASIAAASSMASPAVNGYYSYFSKINAAPLRDEDGEMIPTGFVPSVEAVLAAPAGPPNTPGGLRRVPTAANLRSTPAAASGTPVAPHRETSNPQ